MGRGGMASGCALLSCMPSMYSFHPHLLIYFSFLCVLIPVTERVRGVRTPTPLPLSDLTLVWDWNSYIERIDITFKLADFFLWNAHCIFPLNWIQGTFKNVTVLGTSVWSVRLCSQNSISRANGDRRSQIEKHVVVSAFSAGRQLCILYDYSTR